MNFSGATIPIILLASAAVFGCSPSKTSSFYAKLTKQARKQNLKNAGKRGKILGEFGGIKLKPIDFNYADGFRVLDAGRLQELSPSSRRLYIRRLLLRKKILNMGIREGLYDDAAAAAYLAPRLERLMEEYFFYRKANYPEIERRVKRLGPSEAVFKEFLKKSPVMKKGKISESAARRVKERIMRNMARKKFQEKRRAMIKKILRENPRMKLY